MGVVNETCLAVCFDDGEQHAIEQIHIQYDFRRTEYTEGEKVDEEAGVKTKTAYGVAKLIDEQVFTDLYPLHDGELAVYQLC